MCWYVNFNVSLIDRRATIEIEQLVLSYQVKPTKKGIEKVDLVQGTIDRGFRTALHCDCDNIIIDEKTNSQKLLHYPELFEEVIRQPKVSSIKVWWAWQKDEVQRKDLKVTITEFLAMNNNLELSRDFNYKILKDSYV